MRVASGKKRRYIVICLALAAFPATPAQRLPGQPPITPGVTAHAIMPVTLEVIQSCHVTATDLNFGAIAANSPTPVLGQATIDLTCGAGVNAEIALDAGTSPGNNTSRRQMLLDAGRGRLDYDLFQDAGRTVHWGDRSGVDTLEIFFEGTLRVVPVYGQIPAGQRVPDGTYSDTITVTVHY
jgi:spore coat protein U-like protein